MADKYFTVRFRVNKFEFLRFQKAQELDISHKMIMQEFCQQCSEMEITVFDKKKRKSITLPKGFLTKKNKND